MRAPPGPTAIVATGTSAGICTIESSESSPPANSVGTGIPMTGSVVWAATTPAKCAAPPAAAIKTCRPRWRADAAYSRTASGDRWALITCTSWGTPNSSSTVEAA